LGRHVVPKLTGIVEPERMSIARQQLAKTRSRVNEYSTNVSVTTSRQETYHSPWLPIDYISSRAEKVTSTVTLRVVGGDEKGSLKSERVKYEHESQVNRTRERIRWRRPAAYTKDTRSLVREGAPEKQDRNYQRVINIWS
jgi:hypothetical protein